MVVCSPGSGLQVGVKSNPAPSRHPKGTEIEQHQPQVDVNEKIKKPGQAGQDRSGRLENILNRNQPQPEWDGSQDCHQEIRHGACQ
jgi:hypothetical protein